MQAKFSLPYSLPYHPGLRAYPARVHNTGGYYQFLMYAGL